MFEYEWYWDTVDVKPILFSLGLIRRDWSHAVPLSGPEKVHVQISSGNR